MLCAAGWCQTQAPPGTVIQNIAYVSYLDGSGKQVSNVASNAVQITSTQFYGKVALLKSANTKSATRGQNVTFNLALSNSGTGGVDTSALVVDGATQQSIFVVDPIPANTHFANVVNAGGATVFYHALGASNGQFTATAPPSANIDSIGFAVPTLNAGQAYLFSFNVRVDDNASGSFSNIAAVWYSVQSKPQTLNSGTVTVSVPLAPPTIGYYTDPTFTHPATVATIGGTIHIQAEAAACNVNPLVAETHQITITSSQTHDLEQFQAVETGPNTGVFEVQSVPLADAHTVPVVQKDGTLEVYRGEILTATIVGCGSAASAVATITVDPGPISGFSIQKTADEINVDSGSLVGYTLVVTNGTSVDLPNTTVVDTLPPGFMYQPHSSTLISQAASTTQTGTATPTGSTKLPDPSGGRGPILTFSVGDVPVGGSVTVHYYVRLTPQANNLNATNTAYAASGVTRSNITSATIRIIAGVFDTNGVIFGKVYADCNGNHLQDDGEPGVPGVRIYLDNGTFAVTDEAGKYSIYGVTARLHGLKMDSYTLPEGFTPEAISSRNAGDGKSLFVDMIAAELHRADFALTGCSADSMKVLSARAHAKGTPANEAASLLKKSPLLDRTEQSLEQRRSVIPFAVLGEGDTKDAVKSASQVLDSSINIPAIALEKPSSSSSSNGSPVPAAPLPMSIEMGLGRLFSYVEGLFSEPETAEPQEPDTKDGLRVEKLIRPDMTNDFDFIGLKDGQVVDSTQRKVILKGVLGTNFVLYVNGKEVSADRIGQRSTEAKLNLQVWLYYGLELHPGTNVLEARMFDTFGNERGFRKVTVIAPGAMASILIKPGTLTPVADGKTALHVRVLLMDAHGVPVTSRTPVTLETTAGKWDVEDLNPKEPGTQVFIEGGEGEFRLMPPTEPLDGKIVVTSGTLSSDVKVAFVPELRPLMAIGVVDQTLSFRSFTGTGGSNASFYTLQNELNRLEATSSSGATDYTAHVGTFIKGRVWGDTLLTMSYDSDKQSGDPMFRDAQPDDYYLVYGDSSTRGFDAQSTSRLYLRLDRGKDYMMYGDYNTGDSTNAAKVLSNINRSFTGFKIHQQDSHFEYTAFTTRDSIKQYVEEIPANGTSGPYLVSRMDVVLNSETVEILIRNRNQPALILQDTTEVLLTDYAFDALTGEITFKQPVPSYDQDMNPVSIRVTYEFNDGGPKYWMSGVNGSARFQKLRVGGTYYDDKTPASGLRLWGTSGTYEFSKTATLVGEFARTWTPIDGYGNGAHAEFKQKNDTIDTRIYYGRTDATFNNPNSMLNKGSGESGANITWKVRKRLHLKFEMERSEATDTGVSQTGILATVQIEMNKTFSFEVGYRHAGAITSTESLSGTNPSTTTPPASAAIPSIETAANDDVRAKFTVKPPMLKKVSLYSEYEADMFDSTKQMLALGGTYQFSPKGKFYVRQEVISSLGNLNQLNGVQQQNSMVWGIDTTYLKDEHIFSEYRAEDAFSGRETEAAIGLRNVFAIRPGLKFSTTGETVKTLTGVSTNSSLALTGSLDYTASKTWKSSGRFEWRNSSTEDSILGSAGVAIKLSDNYTLLNRSVYSVTMPKTSGMTDRLQVRIQDGISWRPAKSNKFTVLTMFELKEEKDGTQTIVIPDRKVAILTVGANYLPNSKTVVSARYATKLSNDITDVTDSTLDGHMTTVRVIHDIGQRWDGGVESSALFSDHFNNVQYATGAEVGFKLRQNLWLSAGYNFTGFYDRDLSGEEATRRGPFIRMRFKFDEAMFPFLKSEEGH